MCSGHVYREKHGLPMEPPLLQQTGVTTTREGNRRYQREWARRRRATNPEPMRAARRRWASGNGRRYTVEANARRRAALTGDGPQFLTVLFSDPCSYCGTRERIGPDHIDPLIRGGGTDSENLTAACESCNKSKCDRPLLGHLLAVA